jgi:hypothetical protein
MKKSPFLSVVFVWLVVAIPLGWGVAQAIMSSSKLFLPAASTPSK